MFQRIVVPLDGSKQAEQALPIAARMARASGGSIVLVRVVLPPLEFGKYAAPHSIAWERQAFATERAGAASYLVNTLFTHNAELAGIEVELGVAVGLVAPAIVSVARSQEADVIVICSHGDTRLKRWFFGSVAHEVMKFSPVPTLILHEQGTRLVFHAAHPLRALVILDDSPHAMTVLEPAAHLLASLATPTPGILHLQRVLNPSSADGLWLNPCIDKIWREAEASVRKMANALRHSPAAADLTITASVTTASNLIETIKRQTTYATWPEQEETDTFDLIAMPMQRRKGLRRLFRSSVTDHLSHATKLPLLIAPACEETSSLHAHQ